MRVALRYLVAFVAAVLVTAATVSVFSSQFVYSALSGLEGVAIPMGVWIKSTVIDLRMVADLITPIIGTALLAGFLVAGGLNKWTALNRKHLMIAAGATAWLATLLIMSQVFALNPVAGARTTLGLVSQIIGGGLGGYIFHRMSQPRTR